MSRTLVLFAIGVAAVTAASPSTEDIQNALDLLGLSKDDVDAIQSAKSRRASPAGPSIDTEDGNIVFSVEDGKHVGFKFPDNSVVNVDELPAEMSEYADHGIKLSTAAMSLGYKVGSAKAEAQSTIATTLDFVKSTIEATARDAKAFTDKQDQVNKNLESGVDTKLSGVDTKLAAFDAKIKSTTDALTNAVNTKLEQQTDATTASTAKLTKDVAAVTKTVTDMVKVMEKTAECAGKELSFNPITVTCCKAKEKFNAKEKKCKLPGSFGGEQGNKDIMTPEAMAPLWIRMGRPSMEPMKLCFSSKRDGWSASTFHSKCNSQGRLFSVQRMKTGRVFGGYMHSSMGQSGRYARSGYNSVDSTVVTGSGWMFRVEPNDNKKITILAHKRNSGSGYYHNPSYIMTWGGGHDLSCEQNFNHCYSDLGHNYGGNGADTNQYTSNNNRNFFAGRYSWNGRNDMSDYEVYLVKDQ